jgi:hypothetical protein
VRRVAEDVATRGLADRRGAKHSAHRAREARWRQDFSFVARANFEVPAATRRKSREIPSWTNEVLR